MRELKGMSSGTDDQNVRNVTDFRTFTEDAMSEEILRNITDIVCSSKQFIISNLFFCNNILAILSNVVSVL